MLRLVDLGVDVKAPECASCVYLASELDYYKRMAQAYQESESDLRATVRACLAHSRSSSCDTLADAVIKKMAPWALKEVDDDVERP